MIVALRPLSLTLALASTTTGIIIAYKDGAFDGFSTLRNVVLILLVTVAGVFAQSGANLVNDYFEGSFHYKRNSPQKYKFLGAKRSRFDILVFMLGLASFGAAALIGLYLIYITNIFMLFIGLAGIIGGYAYTGEPFVYKRKALGVPLSFFFMGPLMVFGAYFVFTQTFSLHILYYSLPISFFIPLLMLSNEMRDYERDKGLSLGTLSVKAGIGFSKRLYLFLMISSYALVVVLMITRYISPLGILVFVTAPLAIKAYRSASASKRTGIPITNQCHFLFSVIYLIALRFS